MLLTILKMKKAFKVIQIIYLSFILRFYSLLIVDEWMEDDFYKFHKIKTFDELKSLEISTNFCFIDSNKVKISD